MRGSIVAAIVLAGCYHPNAANGVPCASNLDCPSGQTCDVHHAPPICVAPGTRDDAAIAIDSPTPDAPMACTGMTVCDPSAPICDATTHTCRGCVADAECGTGACTEYNGHCVTEPLVIFVAPTGSDLCSGTSCCTSMQPCKTFAVAMMQLTATRRTIRVASGTYTDNTISVSDTNGRVVISGPQLDYAGTTLVETSTTAPIPPVVANDAGTDVVVEGVAITPSGDGVIYTGTMTVSHVSVTGGSHAVLANTGTTAPLHVWASHFTGASAHGINTFSSTGSVDIQRTFVASNAGGGLGAKGSATISIVNSVFTGNGTQAISFRLVGSATVQFCTIAYNTNSPGVQSDAQTMLAIDSTILYANGAAANGQLLCNGGCTPIYSLFSNVPAPPGTGNVSGDPQFASVNGQDFHIAQGSPADNAGDPAASTAIDFDGNPRPQPAGSPPDIGAFEVP